ECVGSGSYDGGIKLWDAKTFKEARSLGPKGGLYMVRFSPDGKILATAGDNKQIYLWEVASGKEIRTFGQHDNLIHSLSFTSDGRFLASSSYDNAIKLWEITTGREVHAVGKHQGWAWSISFAPDNKTLVSGSRDGSVMLWDATGRGPKADVAGPLAEKKLEEFWNQLAGSEADKAYQAVWVLQEAPNTVDYLTKQLKPAQAPKVDPDLDKRIAKWIADLDADLFATREKASNELELLGRRAENALRDALKKDPPLEMRRRIDDLLDLLQPTAIPPERLREIRAVAVLENITTRAARDLLEALAKGHPEALLTKEAVIALERTKRLAKP